jgi:inner membrane protein
MRIAAKPVLIVAIALTLLVPLAWIESTVRERASRRQEAIASVQASFAGRQTVAIPFVVWPYVEEWQESQYNKDAKRDETVRRSAAGRLVLFGNAATVRAAADVRDDHYRGLHRVRTFESRFALAVDVTLPPRARTTPQHPGGRIQWQAPLLVVPVTDVRGVRAASLSIDGRPRALEQGPGIDGVGGGVHARLADAADGATLAIALDLTLAGMESLAVVPTARANDAELTSPWPHPSFTGRFLPVQREVGADGFRARWTVSSLSSAAQAQLAAAVQGARPGAVDWFQTDFVQPVNVYLLAERATKYAALFPALVFAALFVFEALRRTPLHPLQYALVGLALAIFFLLLLALSEHLEFALAYTIGAAACVALVSFYLRHALQTLRRTFACAAALGALYGVLYVILAAEQMALLMGALVLFAVLAAVMTATRRVDWYALGQAPACGDAADGVSAARSA